MTGSSVAYLAPPPPPADFAGADDLAKEREPGIEIIKCTSKSLIITSYYDLFKTPNALPWLDYQLQFGETYKRGSPGPEGKKEIASLLNPFPSQR